MVKNIEARRYDIEDDIEDESSDESEYEDTDVDSDFTDSDDGGSDDENELDGDIEDLCATIAKIDKAIHEEHGFYLRSTQLLAIITFINSEDSGVLEQVSTGEGKSLIIVALSIYKALQGINVDVVTSSSILAGKQLFMLKDF